MYSTGPAPRESTTGPAPRESTLDVGAARLFRPCAGLASLGEGGVHGQTKFGV